MNEDKKAQPKLEKVKLKTPHRHAGSDHKTGDTLEVAPHVAEHLRRRGVVE